MNGYEAKHQKASDNIRLVRKITAIAIVALAALCCYCITVYAWFQADIVNTGNTLTAGSYFSKVEMLDKEGKLLWESECTDLDQTFELNGAASSYADVAQICVSNIGEEGKALAFRYQLELTADGVSIASASPAPENSCVLEPGKTATVSVTVQGDVQELRLQFHTAFKESGAIATLHTGSSSTTAAAPTAGTETTISTSPAQAVQASPAGEKVTTTSPQTTAAAGPTAAVQSEPSLSEGEAEPTEVLPASSTVSTFSTAPQSDTTQSTALTTDTQPSEIQTDPVAGEGI